MGGVRERGGQTDRQTNMDRQKQIDREREFFFFHITGLVRSSSYRQTSSARESGQLDRLKRHSCKLQHNVTLVLHDTKSDSDQTNSPLAD